MPGAVRLRLRNDLHAEVAAGALRGAGFFVTDDPQRTPEAAWLLVALEPIEPVTVTPEPITAREIRPRQMIRWLGETHTVHAVGRHGNGLVVLTLPGRLLRTAPDTPMWRVPEAAAV